MTDILDPRSFGISLPDEEYYKKYNQSLLDRLYGDTGPEDIPGKIQKCSEYLESKFLNSNQKPKWDCIIFS